MRISNPLVRNVIVTIQTTKGRCQKGRKEGRSRPNATPRVQIALSEQANFADEIAAADTALDPLYMWIRGAFLPCFFILCLYLKGILIYRVYTSLA